MFEGPATRPPVACERPAFHLTPAISTESTLTGVHRRAVKDGAVSTADLLDEPVVPALKWLSAAPAMDEAAVWAALDAATRRPSPALDSAVAAVAGVSNAPAAYLAYAGVRVDVKVLTISCAEGAVLKAIVTTWTDAEAGVTTCGAGAPTDRLARKARQTYC